MNDVELKYLETALSKWARGIAVSTYEFKLILDLIKNGKLSVDIPGQGEVAGMQQEFVATIEQWANNLKQQGKR